ncbi:hypothetical protein [Polaribacter sargassicola]|uniref:hypothetical protein n=1 Tax=Polaribacter sargassicola TaxID=2836891 RepID=UPI001F378810|nr:hypothetical protein [Polaribacter sp. DS7-9]MCG1034985.1 hypothetical protein [Polaribacter sp. DS7-9]
MNFKNSILILFTLLFFSCEENQITLDADNLLLGNWVEPVYNGETTTYKRGESLPNKGYGISFNQQNIYTERTSGWCGTPPLSYFNVEGTFELKNQIINISKQSFPTDYALKIVSLTETELVVKKELTEQEIDHKNLIDLFTEIEELAYSISCTDINNWSFTAYGAKACGGPQGYIPYSNQIDIDAFLEKIKIYTQAEKDYNEKHGIISDCALAATPVSIECQNGYPILKY